MSQIVIAVVDDMFFASKIRAVAEAVGVEISFPRSKEAVLQKVQETKSRLVIVDLHNQKIDPNELARELPGVRLLGFFSHVQTDLQRNAIEAGFEEVIPRSVFARDLPKILATDNTEKHGSDF
ncbi:MAG TPA: hypothetical protein VF290_13960 [Pyrinomonadaceae bacterium]